MLGDPSEKTLFEAMSLFNNTEFRDLRGYDSNMTPEMMAIDASIIVIVGNYKNGIRGESVARTAELVLKLTVQQD